MKYLLLLTLLIAGCHAKVEIKSKTEPDLWVVQDKCYSKAHSYPKKENNTLVWIKNGPVYYLKLRTPDYARSEYKEIPKEIYDKAQIGDAWTDDTLYPKPKDEDDDQ